MATEHQDSNNEASLVEQVTEYVQLQLTATKLSAIEYLSLTLSNGFGILLAVVAAMFALMFILGAITLWVARAIGSLEWAMMISANRVEVLAEEYSRECFLRRDDYMVERAATVVAWFDGRAGGTAYTVARARALGCEVINLYRDGQMELF